MASSSPESDPVKYFGFKDLHGFKDFVGYVFLCTPDKFPEEEWLQPCEQMNLERAFVGLRYGLDLATKEKGEHQVISECRRLVDEAYDNFIAGEIGDGKRKLYDVRMLIKKLPSR
ncbi:MAG: hypothetical protein KDA69_10905 [Planctomycetaceae bacterium]|nr:hypothetical protein [Planctomycetaceae bacterium]MCA9044821.1 hypothetical protein [Planctomycetaceae bacterium]